MRTTINIDDTTYDKVKHLAEVRKDSVGSIVSELLEKGMAKDFPISDDDFPSIPSRKNGRKVTMDFVNQLRDEEGI